MSDDAGFSFSNFEPPPKEDIMYMRSTDTYTIGSYAKAIYFVGRDGGTRLNVREASGLGASLMLVRRLYVC